MPKAAMPTGPSYKAVRALKRGIALLQELNRNGGARPAQLAAATGLDRTTTYRMLVTLEDLGLVRQSAQTDDYILTDRVRSLSEGFTENDRTTQIVGTHLGVLFQKVLWPTDFATFERGAMIIRDTTHRFSPYSVHRAMIGQPRPLFSSALGRAALAGATPEERGRMIEIARGHTPAALPAPDRIDEHVAHIAADYAKRGYGWSVGGSNGRISAIGVAVRTGTGTAALNLVFFSSAMGIETAAERFLAQLQDCAAQIEADLASGDPLSATTTIPAIETGSGR